MRIYIATRYERKGYARHVAALLRALGHEVVSTWHDHKKEPLDREDAALRDLREIDTADALLSLTEHCERTKGGMHAEFGYALARGKRLLIAGPRITIFHHLPGVEDYDATSLIPAA